MNIKHLYSKLKKKLFPENSLTLKIENTRFEVRRNFLLEKIRYSDEKGVSDEKYGSAPLIVSLTSYGRRLYDVPLTIESIMQQTLPPNRIILNIDAEDAAKPLPKLLQKQVERGLEIVVVPEHIRSYKKLLPTMSTHPEAVIITVDDDCLYDHDLVERLYNTHLQNPGCVIANRTHSILLDKNGMPRPYRKWEQETAYAKEGNRLFPTGVGGVLYPPGALHKEVNNQDAFTSLAPTADDIWFHAMTLLNGTKIIKAPSHTSDGRDFITDYAVQDMGLLNQNVEESNGNDLQFKAVYEKYDIYPLLQS